MQTTNDKLSEKAYLTSYAGDDYRVDASPTAKPAVIICPGGGWMHLSEREGEPIAIEFALRGYAAYVLHYTVSTDQKAPGDYSLIHQAMADMEAAYDILLDQAAQNRIDANRITVLGFSAGGQLAALFGAKHPELYACVLCYPLLDIADEVAFVYSSKCPEENRTIMEQCFAVTGISTQSSDQWSTINPMAHITQEMPRTFIWHGATDDFVRVNGSLHYANQLLAYGIRTELHIYDNCGHGVSLGTRETAAVAKEINPYCTVWFAQLLRWMEELGNEKE